MIIYYYLFQQGRKFAITHVQNKMVELQNPYFRVKENAFYEQLSEQEINDEFDRINEPRRSVENLRNLHRTRTISCWHDTSEISNSSHLLIMFSTFYDPAIFYTDDEYFEKSGNLIISHPLHELIFNKKKRLKYRVFYVFYP